MRYLHIRWNKRSVEHLRPNMALLRGIQAHDLILQRAHYALHFKIVECNVKQSSFFKLKGTWTSKIIFGKLKYICLVFQECVFILIPRSVSIEINLKHVIAHD